MSTNIGDIITKTQWKSFGSTNIEPLVWHKCFARILYPNGFQWFRGQIERVQNSNGNRERKCVVRMLDHGFVSEVSVSDLYPHRRFSSESSSTTDIHSSSENRLNRSFDTKLEYLAIRCSLLPNGYQIRLSEAAIKQFSQLVSVPINFTLKEQFQLNPGSKRKCWYTELKCTLNNQDINCKVIETSLNDQNKSLKPQANDRFKLLKLIKEKTSSSSSSATDLQLQQSKSIDLNQQQSTINSVNLSLPSKAYENSSSVQHTIERKE